MYKMSEWETWLKDEVLTHLPMYARISINSFLSFRSNQVPVRAAALTYTSLLALVPFLVILTAIAGWLGYLDFVLAALPALNKTVGSGLPMEKIISVIDHARKIELSNMGIVGSIGLFLSFVLAMSNLEKAMNIIWSVHKIRAFYKRILMYIPFLIFLCLFLLIFAWMLLKVKQYLDTLFQGNLIQQLEHGLQLTTIAASMIGLNWLFFVVLFKLVPNTKVNWISAIIGASITTPILYGLVYGVGLFGTYMFNSYSALYGSLAIFPLMMLVLYFSWVFILYGVVLTQAHQEAREQQLNKIISNQ
jgi:membrane protein